MRTLYLDCGMGAAGDMLTAALSELLPDQDAFFEKMNALGIPGVHFEKGARKRAGKPAGRADYDGSLGAAEYFHIDQVEDN